MLHSGFFIYGVGVAWGVPVGWGTAVGVTTASQDSVVWHLEHCPRPWSAGRAWHALQSV